MTTYTIPVQAVPNQIVTTTIGTDYYEISLTTRLERLYISIIKNDVPVLYNRLCRDRNFVYGNFAFLDVDGVTAPTYDKLNTRYLLIWTDDV